MKWFIVGSVLFVLLITFNIYNQDHNLHQEQLEKLKHSTEAAAQAAAQYENKLDYAEGKLVFNQVEATKAAEHIIKTNLRLNNDFTPTINNYWRDKITYKIEFFDDSNTTFPILYQHDSGTFTEVLSGPSVVVTINAGKTRYRIYENPPIALRVSSHAWEER